MILFEGSTTTRKVRGQNRGLELERLIRKTGKLKLLIPEGENRPVGDDSCKLSREIGIVVRQFAPIKISGWHEIADVDKLALYERIVVNSF